MKRMWSLKQLRDIGSQQAKEVIESGEIDNAKPIYCHPVYASFSRDSSVFITFTCLIFNNDETPFTKESFYDYVLALLTEYPDASIMASGFKNLLPISRIQKQSTSLAVQSPNAGGTANDYWTFTKSSFIDEATEFYDGVNPLNRASD